MKTNIPKSSILQLLRYQILEARFQIKETEVSKIAYTVEVLPSIVSLEEIEEKHYRANLQLQISIKGKSGNKIVHKVSVLIVGEFEGKNLDQENFKKLCRLNGVASLLMLARSYIASVTALHNIKPIVLPFFNLVEARKQKKKNE
ncbi:MAG: hypothetical protein PWP54_646 [Thermosipho sp. (in: thermotogales)]|nr:hypothetical protein [Thermosipho sp. (in: thermotogales)]MDN5324609.1 hypothetical protein [Thermosipho sp. (in: thermotogales)]